MTEYNYSISEDTLNQKVEPRRLHNEIVSSDITIALKSVNTSGDYITIEFKSALSLSDNDLLNSIIASHTGEKLENHNVIEFDKKDSNGFSIISIQKPIGDFQTFITHNFCDNSTWESSEDSSWDLIPGEGELYMVEKAEVQFEHDVNISSNSNELYLEYHAWVGGGSTSVVHSITFNHIRKIFEYGNTHYHSPSLPEMPTGLSTVVFDYASKLLFFGSETPGSLAFLRIKTKDNNEIFGSYASVGFVVNTENL